MPENEEKLIELKEKVKEAETELAVTDREIERIMTKLNHSYGITDTSQAQAKAVQLRKRISQYEQRISSLLVRAEQRIRKYEGDLSKE